LNTASSFVYKWSIRIESAFSGTTGHSHDATTGEGPQITTAGLIGMDLSIQTQMNEIFTSATGTTTIPLDNTIPQITEGDEYITQAITPLSAANILYIECELVLSNTAAVHMIAALFQDATVNALAAVTSKINTADDTVTIYFAHKMTAGTTSATTFRLRAGGSAAGTTRINGRAGAALFGGVCASSLKITEIKDT